MTDVEVAFVLVHAWLENIECAYKINQWATTSRIEATMRSLLNSGKRVFLIFTHMNPEDGRGKRIVGLAQMLTTFINEPYDWPVKAKHFKKARCCNIIWLAKGLDLPKSRVEDLPTDAGDIRERKVGMAALTLMLKIKKAVEVNEYVTAAQKLIPKQEIPKIPGQNTITAMFGNIAKRDLSPKRGRKH